jgi:hypothetical protein
MARVIGSINQRKTKSFEREEMAQNEGILRGLSQEL